MQGNRGAAGGLNRTSNALRTRASGRALSGKLAWLLTVFEKEA